MTNKGPHKLIFGPDGRGYCEYCASPAPFDGGCGSNLIQGGATGTQAGGGVKFTSAPPLSVMKKPSNVETEVFERHFARGRLADVPELIDIQRTVHGDLSSFEACAQRVVDFVPLECVDSFGLFKAGNSLPELNVTAVMQEQLLIALLSLKELEEYHMRCLHQHKPDSSTIDVLVGEDVVINGKKGTIPRLVMEVSVDKNKSKGKQLFAYVNNLSSLWPDDHQFIMLGVTILALPQGSSVRLSGYYKSWDQESPTSRLSEVLLYQGNWDTATISRVLSAVACLCQVPLTNYDLQKRSLPVPDSGSNVHFDEGSGVVTKIFDYRERGGLVSRRRHEFAVRYISGAHLVLDAPDLRVLQYNFIPGSHTPTAVSHILSVMTALDTMHRESVVFADLRLSNCVFREDGSSALIDFDWTGKERVHKYPEGFNADIGDGARHPMALPGSQLRREHDLYALAELMKFFLPETGSSDWEKALDLINRNELLEAIRVLEPLRSEKLSPLKPFPATSTGSPPQGNPESFPPHPSIRARRSKSAEDTNLQALIAGIGGANITTPTRGDKK